MNRREFNAKLAGALLVEDKISLLDNYANELFDKGKFKEATGYYEKAYSLETRSNAKAYFAGQMGICHYNTGHDKQALHLLLKSMRFFNPKQAEFMSDMYGYVCFHLGSLYEYCGKQAKSLQARKICEKYIESQEKETQWMLYAGISRNLEALGRHDEAIQYSQKAIQVLSDNDPGLAYLYESMGNNYMSLKQPNEAIKCFARVLELDPSFERLDEIHLKMGDCYHQLTNHQMALETYLKILELKQISGKKGNPTWLYIKIAHCYFRLEQYERSLLVALEALHLKPRDKQEKVEIRSYLTNNYCELGRYQDAVQEGEKTIKMARRFFNDNIFYVRMALSYHKLGDKKSFTRYRALCRKMFRNDSWNKYLEKL